MKTKFITSKAHHRNPYVDDGVSVDEPHHPGLGVARHSAAEPRAATFGRAHSLGFGHEARLELLCFGLKELGRPLPAGLHLPDPLDGHHALGQLGLVHNAGLSGALDDGAGLVSPVQVGGPADVLARVLGVRPPKVHRHVTKVVDWGEAGLWGKLVIIKKIYPVITTCR